MTQISPKKYKNQSSNSKYALYLVLSISVVIASEEHNDKKAVGWIYIFLHSFLSQYEFSQNLPICKIIKPAVCANYSHKF